jgi:hypothetical protein
MAKRTIIICDFCKQESDPDTFHKLQFCKPGQRKGNTFEICPACASEIQTQLVSNDPPSTRVVSQDENVTHTDDDLSPSDMASTRRQELEDPELDENDLLIIAKRGVEAIADEPEAAPTQSQINGPKTQASDGPCTHMNRGTATLGTVPGTDHKVWYKKCRDCNEKIPVNSLKERAIINKIDVDPDDDIRVGTNPKIESKEKS